MNSIRMDEELGCVETHFKQYLRAEGDVLQVGDVLRDISCSGGKRIRPRLLLLAARCGPLYMEKKDRLCCLAALVEMVHAASLIHDDIVDDSPLRRGKPSVQAKYGKDQAVYAGDLVLSRIVHHLFAEEYYRVGALFGQAVEEMCVGELVQMRCRYQPETTTAEYLRSIDGKTAALCRLACAAGAIESGCPEETVDALTAAGENFGYLFQIRDDLLDFVSSEAEEGKPTQSDFRSGILTLPVLYAMESSPYAKQSVTELLQKAEEGVFTDADAAALTLLVRKEGGLERAVSEMKRYAQKALSSIESLRESETKDVFRSMVTGLIGKELS